MFRASGANIQKQTNSANGVPAHPVSPQVSPCHDLYSDIQYNMYCIVLLHSILTSDAAYTYTYTALHIYRRALLQA